MQHSALTLSYLEHYLNRVKLGTVKVSGGNGKWSHLYGDEAQDQLKRMRSYLIGKGVQV